MECADAWAGSCPDGDAAYEACYTPLAQKRCGACTAASALCSWCAADADNSLRGGVDAGCVFAGVAAAQTLACPTLLAQGECLSAECVVGDACEEGSTDNSTVQQIAVAVAVVVAVCCVIANTVFVMREVKRRRLRRAERAARAEQLAAAGAEDTTSQARVEKAVLLMAAFDLLPTFDYTASKKERASSSAATSSTEGGNPELKRRSSVEEDCCSICLGPFTEKKCCTLPCTHIFHHECARGWLGEGKSALQDSCPLCKAPLLQGELLDRAKEVVNDDSQLREQLFGQAITQLGLHDMEEAMETRQQMTEDAERDLARASDRGGASSAFVRDSDAIMQTIISPRRTSVDAAAELPIRMPNPAQLRQQGSGDFRTIATLGRDSRDDPASPSGSRSDNSHYAANYELSVEMPAYARGRSVEEAPEGEVSANTARLGMRPPPTAQERV